MPPILYLIDGHALAYRAYFALTAGGSGDRFSTRSGEPTAGVYGFVSVLLRMLEQDQPEYMAVAFDTGKTFRDQIFPEYKATRAKMPDDLSVQIKRLRQVVDTFGFPRLEAEGYEADDVLGSIARQAVEKGFGVKIITGDRDLLQLVDDRIIVNLPGRQLSEARDYTAADVMEYLGVRPDQVIDYKALVGDSSDNIPGVAGVGNKTATTLLEKYGTLDEVFAHLDELSAGVRKKLEAGRESAYLSRDLATIRTDVKVSLDLEKARVRFEDPVSLLNLFNELEFRSLIGRLEKVMHVPGEAAGGQQMSLFQEQIERIGIPPAYELNTRVVDTPESLQELVGILDRAEAIAFDTETDALDALRCNLVGISLAVQEGEGFYIPVGHRTGERQLPLEQVIEALRPAMTDPNKAKMGHNIKFDAMVLAQFGLEVAPLSFDTMIAEWLSDPSSRHLGLKRMADVYFGIQMTEISTLIGKGKAQITMDLVPVESAAPYAAADAEVTLRLVPVLQQKLQEHNAVPIFESIEMPLVPVLIEMEQAGISIDPEFFKGMSSELNRRMTEIEERIYGAVGYKFNLNSTQQLAKALFEELGLNPPDRRRRTSSGHFSTSAEVLEEMAAQHPVVEWMLEYRELAKLKSTYVDALPQQLNDRTGCIHTSFSQTGTVTGRVASSDPNLQNIPTRTEEGRRVRSGFVARPGYKLLSVDYSQIELRVVADMSGDEAMLEAFRAGQDIHATTAAAIYGVPLESVTKEQRSHAKSINFGLTYGMGAFGLTRYTGLTLAEAENFVKAYYLQFPGVKAYLDEIRRTAAKQGYVETLLGRRRYFPNLASATNANLRSREEREAINAPIQGTAADIMKLAMIKVPPALRQAGLQGKVLLTVHDELLLEVPEDEVMQTARVVRDTMENAFPLSVALETEARSGKDWGHLEPLSMN
jgi:DNA polymerase-1